MLKKFSAIFVILCCLSAKILFAQEQKQGTNLAPWAIYKLQPLLR